MLADAFAPYTQATVTLTAGAAATSSPLPKGEYFEVQNTGTGAVFFDTGPATVVVAAATGTPVLPSGWRQFRRSPGSTHISIIAPSGGGTVYVTGGVGAPGARSRIRGRGTGGPTGPVAIFDAPLTTTLVPVRAGDPTFTFTRATTAYVADHEGILRNAVSGEARFQGARRVRNFALGNSTNLTNAQWVLSAASVSFGVVGPTGQADANTVTATGPTALVFQNVFAPIGYPTGVRGVTSAWLRRRTGTGAVFIRDANNAGINITSQLDGTWKRFGTASVIVASPILCPVEISTSGDAVDVAYAQYEVVDGQSNQAPGDYVSVGVLAAPFHGCGVDGVKYFDYLNPNVVT